MKELSKCCNYQVVRCSCPHVSCGKCGKPCIVLVYNEDDIDRQVEDRE